jgi:Tfp pilus assembly protein PilX
VFNLVFVLFLLFALLALLGIAAIREANRNSRPQTANIARRAGAVRTQTDG